MRPVRRKPARLAAGSLRHGSPLCLPRRPISRCGDRYPHKSNRVRESLVRDEGSGPILGAVIGGLTPEQKARVEIDRKLDAAGWIVQDFARWTYGPARDRRARVPDRDRAADYLLYGDGRRSARSRPRRTARRSSASRPQSDRYAGASRRRGEEGHPGLAAAAALPLHEHRQGDATSPTGSTRPAPREVFAFHRPETLIEVAKSGETLRQRCGRCRRSIPEGLRKNQVAAIKASRSRSPRNRLKALTPQTMGSGKTILAVAGGLPAATLRAGPKADPLPRRPRQPRQAGLRRVHATTSRPTTGASSASSTTSSSCARTRSTRRPTSSSRRSSGSTRSCAARRSSTRSSRTSRSSS